MRQIVSRFFLKKGVPMNSFKTKYDFQNEFTNKKIQDAFLLEASKKQLSKITIGEICKLAGIHRSTFYRHYSDIYALLSEMEAELFTQLRVVLAPFRQENAISPNGYVKRSLLLRYFHICRWHKNLILVILESNIDSSFKKDLEDCIAETISPALSDGSWATPEYKPYMVRLTADIIISMTLQWLKDETMDYDKFVFLL